MNLKRALPLNLALLALSSYLLPSTLLAAFGVPTPPAPTAPAIHDDRTPVPTDAKQADALKTIKDIYKDEYAKKGADDRRLLATKLLDEGKNTATDPANQYVLLREAKDTAVLAGDIDQALQAAKAMGDIFSVDTFDLINATLTSLRPTLKTPDVQMLGYAAAVQNALAAADKETFDPAIHAAEIAGQYATAAKSMTKTSEAQALKTAIAAQSKAFDDFKTGGDTLKKSKNPMALAQANQDVGLYTALYHKEWSDGLNLVVKGNDKDWSAVAALDAKNPTASIDMLAVADAWYDLGNKPSGTGHRLRLQQRAEYWYNLALPDAEGISKTKIEKRLEAIAAATPSYLGGSDAATKSALPTALDLAKLKDVLRLYQAGDRTKRSDVQRQYAAIEANLQADLLNAPTADFMARLQADIDLRKLMESSGAADLVTGGQFLAISSKMEDYILASKSKDDVAARILGFEKVFTEQLTDAKYKQSFDGTIYNALRSYVGANPDTYDTAAAKSAFADYLKQKNVKSTAVDRFKKNVAATNVPLGTPAGGNKPKTGG